MPVLGLGVVVFAAIHVPVPGRLVPSIPISEVGNVNLTVGGAGGGPECGAPCYPPVSPRSLPDGSDASARPSQ